MKKLILVLTTFFTLTVYAQINPTNNFIAVDLGTPDNQVFTYNSAVIMGKNLGMSQVGLSLTWTSLETAPNTYDFTFLDIADFYYPAYNLKIDLTIAPINTNVLEVPSDLTSLAFDNPIVINRFKKLLDSVKVHLPTLQLSSLVIGSEVDGYLGTSTQWTQYTNFYSSVTAYVKTLWPNLKVACEAMFDELATNPSKNYLQQLNVYSDYIGCHTILWTLTLM